VGALSKAILKYHYFYRFFTYSVKRSLDLHRSSVLVLSEWVYSCSRSALKTLSGGEFDWGGTSVKW
jgi:hypothetical protein